MRIIKMGLAAAALALTMGAVALPAQAADNVPPAEPQGCHGAAAVQYKQAMGDAGATGSAIGGTGNNKDGLKGGQAHSELGRGQTLQQFLAAQCDVGSLATP